MIRAAVLGASGYIGGELLRLLLGHPRVTTVAATSRRLAGRRVDGVHPNLREHTDLVFTHPDSPGDCDVLFSALPHGYSMSRMPALLENVTDHVIDLSADFRLPDPDLYKRYYGTEHCAPHLLDTFVTGLPECHRDRLRTARRVSIPGCNATAAVLALRPLSEAEMIEGPVTVDARTGSSGSGASPGPAGTHAERSGAMRVFSPTGHRHQAEISTLTGLPVRMSATGVEAVRGVQVLCRVRLVPGIREPDVRALFRHRYGDEPFVRVVSERRGAHRFPEPKILSGSNHCDVGFAVDAEAGTVVVMAALDNLVKGGAGAAVQCLNVFQGWPERLGLDFFGLHPV